MIRDVELAEEALAKKAGGPQGSRRCLCLSLFSFLLVAGATTLFCLLHFEVIGPQKEEVNAWPALAHSPTRREMGKKEGQRRAGGKKCADGECGEEIMEKDGEAEGDVERDGGRERRIERNPVPGPWEMLSKYLLHE